MSTITATDIAALVELFEKSDWETLQLEINGVHVHLSKRAGAAPVHASAAPSGVAPVSAAAAGTETATTKSAPPESNVPTGWVVIKAPNLGTVYRAPKPGAKPYVEIGQEVEASTEICLIEVMKLFTAVVAGIHGVVLEILIKDGDMVEHDQPLMLVEPRA